MSAHLMTAKLLFYQRNLSVLDNIYTKNITHRRENFVTLKP